MTGNMWFVRYRLIDSAAKESLDPDANLRVGKTYVAPYVSSG